ncbi:ATP-binding protein [Arcanobacterium phocisimile]|uniref:ATP-binding protein n=1 Tax=Arcanobacterium phocisimile TaxID=1302235 RepID=A0ABX7IEC2_9ACTO|nr:ATP-binding protein [Arcanobacterium phocisimile]QRV01483.1 ATP-binding protein [Arcanobacterium phocisimile]
MKPIDNPYTPNAGAKPPVLAGREEQMDNFEVLLARSLKKRPAQSMIITGLRGVGKTALLNEFRERAERSEWITIELEASKHDESLFRRQIALGVRSALYEMQPRKKWNDRLEKAARALGSFSLTFDPQGAMVAGIGINDYTGIADSQILSHDLTELFVNVGEAARAHQRGVVLLIDEIQFLERSQLEALIMAIHKTVQRALPIALVGAGLPQIAELAGDAKSYSERLFKFPEISSLTAESARDAFAKPAQEEGVEWSEEALDRAIEITEGYPYFIQELGSAVWLTAQESPICVQNVDDAVPLFESGLDESFFRVRLDRATRLQAAYLRAMAQLGPGPQKANAVADVMGRSSKSLGPTRSELINMGLLFTPRHGFAEFTVPHFHSFMLREMPDLIVPERRKRNNTD